MARTKGTYILPANIELEAGAPLDARSIVHTKADLTASGQFSYPYVGMETYVISENKKYRLLALDTTVLANWEELDIESIEISWDDYQELTTEEKEDPTKIYFVYDYPDGDPSSIVPNPAGTSTANLTKIGINNVIYAIKDTGAVRTEDVGAAGGVAELDSEGKVPTEQLPEFTQVQSDFDQDDDTEPDFIKNKPVVDNSLSSTSENAVQNKVVKAALDEKADASEIETITTETDTTDSAPYLYRPTNGTGDRVYVKDLVGGSFGWNQLVNNGNFASTSNWTLYNSNYASFSVSDNVATITANNSASSSLYNFGLMLNSIRISILPDHIYFYAYDIKPSWHTDFGVECVTNYLSKVVDCPANVWTKAKVIEKASASKSSAFLTYPTGYAVSSGSTYQIKNVICIDLTLMFGTEIADYVYSLEKTTVGSGIAWLKSYGFFTKSYYPYDTGSIQSVKTDGKKYVGKNLVNVYNSHTFIVYSGKIDTSTTRGTISVVDNGIKSTNRNSSAGCTILLGYLQAGTYTLSVGSKNATMYISTTGKTYPINNLSVSDITSTQNNSVTFTITESQYILLGLYVSSNTEVYCTNIQLELGSTATTYEPYKESTYPISNIELRGIPKLVNNALVYDGDIYKASGDVTRKYGIVDLGSLDWTYHTNDANKNFQTPLSGIKPAAGWGVIANVIMANYVTTDWNTLANASSVGKKLVAVTPASRVGISDPSYTDADTFKTAMSDVYLVYELATPTTETTTPYTELQICDAKGTEEFIDDRNVPVPVGHNSEYVDLPNWMEHGYYKDFRQRVDETIVKKLNDSLAGNYSKNLFDVDSQLSVYSINGEGTQRAGYRKIFKAGTYTVSAQQGNASTYIDIEKADFSYIGRIVSTSTVTNITFTLNNDTEILIYEASSAQTSVAKTRFEVCQIQIESGLTATTYESYIPTNLELWNMIKALQNS